MYQKSEWVVCDSKILYLFGKLLKTPIKEAIPGSSFFTSYLCIIRMMLTARSSCLVPRRVLLPRRWKVFMALGATIDFEAGTLKRAPKIWQKIGMEWLYRCMKEPKRLFKRYFVDDMQFFNYFGKQLLGIYKDPFRKK